MTAENAGNTADGRSLPLLILAVGLLVAIAYGQTLLAHSGGRWIAPLRDDLIFFQYARSIADGHPYRFFPTAQRTTGATSHLYVIALAALYKAGFADGRLAAGAFFFNALLWLASLALVYGIGRRVLGRGAFAAALLVALTGPVAFGFFAEHDMGLATTLFLLAFYGLASERTPVAATALFLLGWARPEGALVSLSLAAAGLLAPRGRKRAAWIAAGLVGLAGTASMLLFNFALTGEFGFTSLKGKGVFASSPFRSVLTTTAEQLGGIVRKVFLGFSAGARGLYFAPLLGVAALLGFVPRCRRGSLESWLAPSIVLVLALVASSGFADVQHDKYLMWVFVLTAIYAVAGLIELERILAGRITWRVLYGLCAAYALVGSAYFLGDYGGWVARESAVVSTIEKVRALMPPGLRIGVMAGSGIQYYLPDQEVINLNGVTNRAFAEAHNLAAQAEILQDRPELRPDAWWIGENARAALNETGLVGPVLLSAPAFLGSKSHISLYGALCKRLDAGEKPLSPKVSETVGSRELVEELDLCSPEQEGAHNYRRFTRLPGVRLEGDVKVAEFHGQKVIESGYAIFGDEEFDVKVRPGRDLLVVLRTALRASAISLLGPRHRERFEISLSPPVRTAVYADGERVPLAAGALTPSNAELDEVVFRIPARFVRRSTLRLRVAGDHISYHYWFYQ